MNESTVTRRQAPLHHPTKKILCVVANPAVHKGFPVGFYASELTGPYLHFIRAGHEVDICSPKGGKVAFDAQSDPEGEMTQEPNDLISIGFKHHRAFAEQLVDTTSIADVDLDVYDAVFVVGGGSPLVTFKGDTVLYARIAQAYEAGKVMGFICHGACLLNWVTLSDGSRLVDGKTWTGFADSEEATVNAAMGVTVFDETIEAEAGKNPNTRFETAGPFEPFAIRDGNLVTGQQQNSAALVAQLVIEALSER